MDTGIKSLVCEISTSPQKMKAYNINKEWVLQKIEETIKYAKKASLYVAFFAVDSTRAEIDFLEKVYKKAVYECGADEVVVVDTVGISTPEQVYYLTKRVGKWLKDIPIMIHCHNEFGLGVACTLAGIKAGAKYAHVTINGLGEKSGNADLSEVVMASELLYGLKTNIDKKLLYETSKKVSEYSGIQVSKQKPIVGENIFKRDTGLAVHQLISYPSAVEAYNPEIIGREREILLGKKSGKASILFMLKKLGLSVSSENVNKILDQVKKLGIEKKSNITIEEFKEIVKSYN